MNNLKALMELGFKKVKDSNYFDYFANLRVAYKAEFSPEESSTIHDFSDDEIIGLIHKHQNDRKRLNKSFSGFLRIIYVPVTNCSYLSLYFSDGSCFAIDVHHSYEIMKSVLEKTESTYKRYLFAINSDESALKVMIKKMKMKLLKAQEHDDVMFFEEKIDLFESRDKIFNVKDYEYCEVENEIESFNKYGAGRNACVVGCIDGFLLTCELNHCVEEDDYKNQYISFTDSDGYYLLEIGPYTKGIFQLLLKTKS